MSYCTKCGKEVEAGRVMCKECIDAYNANIGVKVEHLPGTKRDGIFAIILFGIAALFIDCLIFAGFGIGVSLSLILLTVIAAIYLKNDKGFSLYALLTAIFALVSSVAITISNDSLTVFLSFALTLLLYTVMIFEVADRRRGVKGTVLSSIKMVYDALNGFFCNMGQGAYAIFKAKEDNGEEKKRKITMVLLGLGLAIPIIVIVVPLLVSSDAAFEGLLKQINGKTVWEIIVVAVLSFVLLLMLFGQLFALKNHKTKEDKKSEFKGIDNTILISFLSVISIIYLFYLLSQLSYFFDGFMGILPIEYTAAEYARRGFFEMCIVAAINLVLVTVCSAISKKSDKGMPVILKVLSTFLAVFSLVLDSTAIAKMITYVKLYGFTRLRLFTTVFMVFCAILFIVAILKVYINNLKYMKTVLVVGATLVLALTFFNVDGFISNYNVNAYLKEDLKTVDINAINELPTLSKVDGLITLAQKANDAAVAEEARCTLKAIANKHTKIIEGEIVSLRDSDFRSFNLYDQLAFTRLRDNYQLFRFSDPNYYSDYSSTSY